MTNNDKTSDQIFSELLAKYREDEEFGFDALKVETAERIYTAMEERGVSQAQLARLLGKSRAYTTKIMRWNVNFTIETLFRISRLLECELDISISPKKARITNLGNKRRSSLASRPIAKSELIG